MNADIIIIGGGIVGLATAYQLQLKNPSLKVMVVEKENEVAKHQSGNNSGVIHSGIYYKPGSLKAINCISGYKMMIDFCRQHEIAHDICGKIIVAAEPTELPTLDNIYNRGIENGLSQIKKITAAEAQAIEPHVRCIAAVHVPYAGIVDYKEVSEKLASLIKQQGGEILLNHKAENISLKQNEITIETNHATITGKFLVNCAGLYSDKIAKLTHPELHMQIIPFRGEYYELKQDKTYLVKNLIYPVPDTNFPFLGVHFTRMIKGGIEAGPNAVFAFKREGYKNTDVDLKELTETLMFSGFRKISARYWKTGWMEMRRSFSKKLFAKALQKLVPEIQENDLVPGGAGVRAMACDKDGNLLDDYYFLESKQVVNVCNAPSPAATSSLSIGLTVAEKVLAKL